MAATVFAGISAVSSIVGGIFGSRSASRANREAKKAQERQQALLNEQAKIQNEYNERKFEVDRENYDKRTQYQFETALQDWRIKTQIRAIQERVDAEKYAMNVENSSKNLTFNRLSEQQGLTREQLAIEDARTENAFQRQDLLVAQLEAEGKASLGQAGRVRSKTLQSDIAQIGRDIAVIDAGIAGEIKESTLNMFDISLGRFAADARVEASRMIRPVRLPEIPAPTKAPEPIWLEPMKVLPGLAAPAQQQSVMAPLISGIGGAASSLASVNWGGAQQTYKPPTIGQNSGYVPGFGGTFGPNYGIPGG